MHVSVRNDFIEGSVLQIPNTVFVPCIKVPNELFVESKYDVNFTFMFIIVVGSLTECNRNVLRG